MCWMTARIRSIAGMFSGEIENYSSKVEMHTFSVCKTVSLLMFSSWETVFVR